MTTLPGASAQEDRRPLAPRAGGWLRTASYAAVAAIYALIVMGGVVRATGSGLGCPDWPLCHGGVVPPPEQAAIIEYTHRALAGLAGLISVVAVVLWVRYRGAQPRVLAIAAGIIGLLVAQVALGAATVALELPSMVVLAHLTLAMLFLGSVTAVAIDVSGPFSVRTDHPHAALGREARFSRLAVGAAAAVFLLMLTGAYVRASGASWACTGFPTCNGELLPFGSSRLVDIHLLHRLVAYGVAAHLLATIAAAWRTQQHIPAVAAAALVVGLFLVEQVSVGAVLVSVGPTMPLQVLHVAGAAALWASVVALVCICKAIGSASKAAGSASPAGAGRSPVPVPEAPSVTPRGLLMTLNAYVNLTKPRIIGLLLLTTLAGMLMAQRGIPEWQLVLFTLVGGALGAAGANAVNCWLDRDIDAMMVRTGTRSIPAGRVQPGHAAWFGVGLAAASFLVLAAFVNVLSAALTLSAFWFYVLIYTRWLKRSTVHNIVIGGAAGAIPPVVGWAAVTGEISPLALALFAIIFMWTPPHFWALALIVKDDYARARVPMLPVVRGDDETRRQIVVYSVLLAGLTILVFALGLLGVVYLAGALILGALFLGYAWQLLREGSDAAARRLFRYSIVYLALIFAVMVVDRQIAF